MEKDAENYSNINMFSSKINICSNKPITTIQKFRCTLTNLNTADEVTRIDGTLELNVKSMAGQYQKTGQWQAGTGQESI